MMNKSFIIGFCVAGILITIMICLYGIAGEGRMMDVVSQCDKNHYFTYKGMSYVCGPYTGKILQEGNAL